MNASAEARNHLRFGFVMEQTLGHVTHYRNLRAAVEKAEDVQAAWYPLNFAPRGRLETLPGLRSNWTLRASVRARRALAGTDHDALFFHTQVTTLFSAGLLRRKPGVISLDATPINYDAVGAAYGHTRGDERLETLKRALNARALRTARAVVAWCEWARRSLIDDYGIPHERISVIAPGVDLSRWPCPAFRSSAGPLRVLFVGADYERKGGPLLVEAARALAGRVELHMISTGAPIIDDPAIHVYRDLTPNSDRLRDLYARADLFALPTLADCFPLAIQEAMAAGLPVVATDVGALGEAVRDGETGLLVPAGNARALAAALETLIADSSLRLALGRAARDLAERHFDSAANAYRILGIMRTLV